VNFKIFAKLKTHQKDTFEYLATLKTPQKSAILNFKEMAKLVVGFELVE
jgi:hypothetical protein